MMALWPSHAPNLYPCVTDRPGIFVTGTAGGPMDIVDSIVMAGAAAAEAAAYIEAKKNSSWHTRDHDRVKGTCLISLNKKTRRRISALVFTPVTAAAISAMSSDCEKVAKALREMPDVVVSRTDMSMCSDAGQALIEKDIKEKGVNRVVVGACAPSLHEQTFRGTVSRAGLNPYFYHHVGMREQDSWVHHNDHDAATEKAVRLMSAGLAKARLLSALRSNHAGCRAARPGDRRRGRRSARRSGYCPARHPRHPDRKIPFLGGSMAQLERVFPNGADARDALHAIDRQSGRPSQDHDFHPGRIDRCEWLCRRLPGSDHASNPAGLAMIAPKPSWQPAPRKCRTNSTTASPTAKWSTVPIRAVIPPPRQWIGRTTTGSQSP